MIRQRSEGLKGKEARTTKFTMLTMFTAARALGGCSRSCSRASVKMNAPEVEKSVSENSVQDGACVPQAEGTQRRQKGDDDVVE
jgi:hypothetical protein